LGGLADLRNLYLQLALGGLHSPRTKTITQPRVKVAQAPLVLRPALITRTSQPRVELILHGPLDDQPRTQPRELGQRLRRCLADRHRGQQPINLLLYLRRWRYGASHSVGLPSRLVRTCGNLRRRLDGLSYLQHSWDATRRSSGACLGRQGGAEPVDVITPASSERKQARSGHQRRRVQGVP